MVLFVDHSGKGFPLSNDCPSWALAESVVPADKMPFHQEISVEGGGLIHADIEDLIAEVERHQNVFELLEYLGLLNVGAATEEFIASQVSGQANP
jgi:hypothetical protein